MERVSDRVFHKKIIMKGITFTVLDIAFILCLFTFALLLRLPLFPHISGDYAGFLSEWMTAVRNYGGLKSLGHEISNYSAAYMIIMSLLSYLDADPLYLLKAVSVFFDYLAAIAVFLIVFQLTHNTHKSILGMGGLLLAPTVVLNGAYWCQCDMIYVTFLLYGIYYLCKGNSTRALLMTAFGLAFKLQALFILPLYVIVWLCPLVLKDGKKCEIKCEIKLSDFLLLPIPYLVLALPGIFLGRDIWNAIGVYLNQTNYYPWLTLNYPNIYAFFGQTYGSGYVIEELGRTGILTVFMLMGYLAYYLYGKKTKLSGELMITTALLSVGIIVYILPHMHERYGLLIDVAAIIYAILRPRMIPVAAGLIISSLIAYMPYLFGLEGLTPLPHALLQLALLIAVGTDFHRQTAVSETKY